MSEKLFVDSIIEVAKEIKGSNITESEKKLIIENFNKKSGSAYERAKTAIEEVIGKKIPENYIIEKTASLNNLQNLLAQMSSAASKWQETKK
jgi:hypothetical protein